MNSVTEFFLYFFVEAEDDEEPVGDVENPFCGFSNDLVGNALFAFSTGLAASTGRPPRR